MISECGIFFFNSFLIFLRSSLLVSVPQHKLRIQPIFEYENGRKKVRTARENTEKQKHRTQFL